MVKQLSAVTAIVLLSLIIVLGMNYAQEALQMLVAAYEWIADGLMQVFSGGQAGNLIRKLIALLVIPLLAASLPALIFWMAKRRWFPYFIEFVWVTWLIQTSALVIISKAG